MSSKRTRTALPLPPGLILVLCAFLPAFHDGCAGDIYPVELPPVLAPYLLGLAAAIWSIAKLKGSVHRAFDWIVIVLGTLCYWAPISLIVLIFAEGREEPSMTGTLVFLLFWLAPIRPAVRGLRRGLDPAWRASRAMWLGAYGSILWFGLWTIPFVIWDTGNDGPLFGTWLALAASVALTITGAMLERDREPRSRSHEPAQLPKSRVAR